MWERQRKRTDDTCTIIPPLPTLTVFLSGVVSEVDLRMKKTSAARNRRDVALHGGGEDKAFREES